MKINDVGIILAPGYRSRAYLQILQTRGVSPDSAILLPGDEPEWQGAEKISVDLFGEGSETVFYPRRNTEQILENNNIKSGIK